MSPEPFDQAYDELFDKAYEKLKNSGLEPKILPKNHLNPERIIAFKVQAGDSKYTCKCYDFPYDLEKLIDIEIKNYHFISDYQAIWSQVNKKVECEINLERINRSFSCKEVLEYMSENLGKYATVHYETPKIPIIEFEPVENMKISIGQCSKEFAVLINCHWVDYSSRIERNKVTIRV